MTDEPITTTSGGCRLITVDVQELKLLREIATRAKTQWPTGGYLSKLIEALKPWSSNYERCQL